MKLLFTIVNHRARTRLDLSLTEYCVADSIYHLSNNPKNKNFGWCYMTQTTMAKIFGLTSKSIINIEKRLLSMGLIEKNGQSKRTTSKWYDNIILDDGIYYANDSVEEIKCFYCDKSIAETPIEIDHYISRANGGKDSQDNLVFACPICNQKKKEMNGDEFFISMGKTIKYPKTEESSHLVETEEMLYTTEKSSLVKENKVPKKTEKSSHYNNTITISNNNINNNTSNSKELQSQELVIRPKKEKSTIPDKTMKETIDKWKAINPLYKDWYGNITQRKSIERLLTDKDIDESQIKWVIDNLEKIASVKFMPNISTPHLLLKNWSALVSQIKKQSLEKKGGINVISAIN